MQRCEIILNRQRHQVVFDGWIVITHAIAADPAARGAFLRQLVDPSLSLSELRPHAFLSLGVNSIARRSSWLSRRHFHSHRMKWRPAQQTHKLPATAGTDTA